MLNYSLMNRLLLLLFLTWRQRAGRPRVHAWAYRHSRYLAIGQELHV